MTNTYDDYDYEPEVPKKKKEKVKKEKQPKEKKKGGWGGRILCLIIGFILGFATLPATVAGIVAIVLNQPVAKTVESVDNLTNGNLYQTLFGSTNDANEVTAGIFNEKYADMKIFDLVDDVSQAFSELGDDGSNLAELNEISPFVGQTIDNLLKSLRDLSIPVDSDDLMEKSFKGDDNIGEYLLECIMNAPAGDLLSGLMSADMNGLLMTLCYGEEGVDYEVVGDSVVMLGSSEKTTLNDLFGEDLTSVLEKIPVDTFITPEPDDTVMCAIAYGSTNRYEATGSGVTMKQVAYTRQNSSFYDDNGELLSVESYTVLSGNVYKLVVDTGKTDSKGSHVLETQYVQEDANNGVWLAYSEESCSTAIRYKKKTIGDLDKDAMSIIDGILLADALGINASSHPILISLAYGTQGEDYRIVGTGTSAEIEMIGNATANTIGDLRERNEDLINAISLSDIMYADSDDVLSMYLVYGREGVHYEIVDGEIVMQQKYVAVSGSSIYNEYGEKISGKIANNVYTDENGTEYNLTASTQSPVLTKDGKSASVYFLSYKNSEAVKFPRTSLGDLAGSDNLITNLTGRIQLGEILDAEAIAGNKIFSLLSDVVIDELPDKLSELTIMEIYEEDIYENDGKTLKSEWKYLLTDADGRIGNYTIDNMSDMIANMKRNIETATLADLHADGFLNMDNDDALTHDVVTHVTISGTRYNFDVPENYHEDMKLGELNVTEAMDYIGSIFTAIDDAQIAG